MISALPELLPSCQETWPPDFVTHSCSVQTPLRQLQTFIARLYRTKDSIVQWHAFKDLAPWSQSMIYPISSFGLCRISRTTSFWWLGRPCTHCWPNCSQPVVFRFQERGMFDFDCKVIGTNWALGMLHSCVDPDWFLSEATNCRLRHAESPLDPFSIAGRFYL